MKLPLRQIDAFASGVFAGNPAAVVLLDAWLADETLQAIALENNLSETAFVVPRAERSPLRWFTPTNEVELCGHATLAAAHVLFEEYFPNAGRLRFETLAGDLAVESEDGLLFLDFPSRPGTPLELTPALVSAIGVRPREARLARDVLAVLASEAEVVAYEPDFDRIREIDAFALIVTAPGEQVDFVSRFFAPRQGVPEDPVTGSAHCTLIPYWAERLGKTKLRARQLSRRGGELVCELRGDRVRIGGAAVEYLRGEIRIPD